MRAIPCPPRPKKFPTPSQARFPGLGGPACPPMRVPIAKAGKPCSLPNSAQFSKPQTLARSPPPLVPQDWADPAAARDRELSGGMARLHFDATGYEDDDGGSDAPPPPHACAYCGVSNAACVVKCLNTGKWFCNGKVHRAGSCIVMHLVKSKNKVSRVWG
eukprot:365621-Chlamydomonas_euryale.AAC.4